MPTKITKLGHGRCRVSTPHGIKAKNTSCGKAKSQKKLLNAIDHGWKPTGQHAKESLAKKLVWSLLEQT